MLLIMTFSVVCYLLLTKPEFYEALKFWDGTGESVKNNKVF